MAPEMLIVSIAMDMAATVPSKRILLVEDDQRVRESIKLLLRMDQHTVSEAGNGHEALQLFTGSRYDVVITDYLMPEMLGDELAQRIRNLAPAQPILMVTAYVEALANGGKPADVLLGKPFSVDDLRRALARTTCLAAAASSLSVRFSRSDLMNRASAVTSVLDEILRQKRPPRASASPEVPKQNFNPKDG